MVYFDNGATTMIKPQSVKQAVLNCFDTCSSAGRSGYNAGMLAGEIVYECREKIAELFKVEDPSNVVFTSNATHALNLAIKGYLKNKRGEVLVSGYEHNSVIRPLRALSRKGIATYFANGMLYDSEDAIKKFKMGVSKRTRAVVLNHVSNVFGFIQPLYELDEIFYKMGIPMILDASQSGGIIPIDMTKLKSVIAICMPGHKALFGPQGTGVMLIRDASLFGTIIEGGSGSASSEDIQPSFMPDKFESGTLNIHGIAGLLEGVQYVISKGVDNIRKHEFELSQHVAEVLRKFDRTRVFCSSDMSVQSGVVSFVNKDFSCEEMAELLSQEDICVRAGLHCSPHAHKSAMTYSTGTVRISFSDLNTHEEIEAFEKAYKKIVKI